MGRLSLNIGRQQGSDKWLLCLADQDSTEIIMLAEFLSEDHVAIFTEFMKDEGYYSRRLPTQSEIDSLFDD